MKKHLILMNMISFSLMLCLAACNLSQETKMGEPINSGMSQSWIDAPLDNSLLPLAPYEIVLHAHAPAGISQVEILINETMFMTRAGEGQLMVTLRQDWLPAAPGNYRIAVQAIDVAGQRGEESSVDVVVAAPATETTTPEMTFTSTTAHTPTLTPRLTPTPIPTLTSTSGGWLARVSVEPLEVFYGECEPNQLDFEVQVAAPLTVTQVYLFVRLQNESGSELTDWNSGFAMNPGSESGIFRVGLSVANIPEISRFPRAILLYQFVGTDVDKSVIGRSQTFRNVSVSHCGTRPPIIILPSLFPPINLPTPTPTVEVIR